MKYSLKIWLRKNKMLSDPHGYTAVMSSRGSVDFGRIVDALVEEGTEYKRETIADIVSRYNRKCAWFAVNGFNVSTGLVYMRAVVTGVFRNRKFDPLRNGVYVSVSQGVELQQAIAETDVEILGEMPEAIQVYQVTNMQNHEADGTLSRSYNAQIKGAHIRIAGEHPDVGVYLVHAGSGAETKLDMREIIINDPGKLIIRVPDALQPGTYYLRIVSQFAAAGRLLKTPRECTFDRGLVVI